MKTALILKTRVQISNFGLLAAIALGAVLSTSAAPSSPPRRIDALVSARLDKLGIPHENVFVDLERRMKCGVGKCGHCQMNDKYVCTDGPVFAFSEIERLEEAI